MNNRPIKFRIWNSRSNQWENPKRFANILSGGTLELESDSKSYSWKEPLWQYTIQQFTGLLDKFAREIYEGDIVKFARCKTESVEFAKNCYSTKLTELGREVGEIVFIRPSFCLSFEHIRYDDIEPMPVAESRYEIIGNKFENPELLT
jgi:uncharacterized phage protein (TIGR01671 family)